MGGRIAILLVLVLCCSISYAEEAVEIPLSEIWAYAMPGTKDVRELEPKVYGEPTKSLPSEERAERLKNSIVQSIRYSLEPDPDNVSNAPQKGFVIEGVGNDALSEADAVLAGHKQPISSFSEGENLTLVFHSMQAGMYVHLTAVIRRGNKIEVHFQFVPHFTNDMSTHFALIPLGTLVAGKYEVKIIEDPMEDYKLWGADQLNPKWREKYVCKDFKYKVD